MREDARIEAIAGHLKIMAGRIREGDYKLSERQIKMLVTLINEINLERPEPREENDLDRQSN